MVLPGSMASVTTYRNSRTGTLELAFGIQVDGEKRHLLRLWASPAEDRPIPSVFANTWGSTEVGDRGGWFLQEGEEPWYPEEPIMGDL